MIGLERKTQKMTKDERILAKVGKLLLKYGVSEEEKSKFLIDLQDTKEDEVEEPENGVEPENEPDPEGESKPEDIKKTEPEEVAETGEESGEEKKVEGEESQEEVEEPPHYETDEVKKTIEGLTARLEAQDKILLDLQEVVAKLGVQKEEGFGASPENPSGGSAEQSEFDRINRARLGR